MNEQTHILFEERSDLSGPVYIEGLASRLSGVRQKTTDNTDGTITIAIRIAASDIPEAFSTSPDGSIWRIHLHDLEGNPSIIGIRQAIKEAAKQTVNLRFQVIPANMPSTLLWGQDGVACDFSIQMLAGKHPYPHFIQKTERAACLKRTVMICTEPGFDKWLTESVEAQRFPTLPMPQIDEEIGIDAPTAMSLHASENLCRLARIHSRREILTSNLAAERVETLIRAYREYIWTERAPVRAEESRRRGLDQGSRHA